MDFVNNLALARPADGLTSRVYEDERVPLNAVYIASFTVLPFFLDIQGRSATETSLFLTPRPLALAVGSYASGRLLARKAPPILLIALGTTSLAGSLLVFAFLSESSPYAEHVLLGLLIAGLGFGFAVPSVTFVLSNAAPTQEMARIGGLVALADSLSFSLGVALMLACVEGAGGVEDVDAITFSFLVACLVACSAFVGVAVMLGDYLSKREPKALVNSTESDPLLDPGREESVRKV